MKKTAILAAVLMMSLAMTACGQKEETKGSIETEVYVETPIAIDNETEKEIEAEKKTEAPKENASEKETESEKAMADNVQESSKADAGYEDNFAVDAEAAEFAAKIKAAVEAQDLEQLADLASYPLYVGFKNKGFSAESREELIGLGADKIFTPELLETIKQAPTDNLSASRAGFSLSTGGTTNIIFGVVDGNLTVRGINY